MEYNYLPDLNGWATLRAVVEKGGVIEAAKALHVGQPAVTKRLRTLEEHYAAPLMVRVSGRLQLTEAGEKVYDLAVQTLDRQHFLSEEISRIAQGQDNLRLEVTSSISKYLLPAILLRCSEVYPNYKIETRIGYSRKIHTRLATRIADLALLEFAPDHPEILVQKWREDELWLVCDGSHPLANTDFIDLEVLDSLSYVLREKQSSMRYTMQEALDLIGVRELNVAIEIGSTDTIIEILTSSKHVSFLPRFVVEERVANGNLYHLKVTGFRIMRTLWIARHRDNIKHPVAEAFINMLRE